MATPGLEVNNGNEDSARFTESGEISVSGVRAYIYSLFPRWRERLTLDTLRPIPIFLGITGPTFCFSAEAFTPPSKKLDKTAPEKVLTRIRLNFAFFLTNYALITAGTAIIVSLMHPKMIMELTMVWILWTFHVAMVKNNTPIVIRGIDFGQQLTAQRRSLILSIITCFVVFRYCFLPFLLTVGISFILVFSHAIMRDPKHIETSQTFFEKNKRAGSADSDDEAVIEQL